MSLKEYDPLVDHNVFDCANCGGAIIENGYGSYAHVYDSDNKKCNEPEPSTADKGGE